MDQPAWRPTADDPYGPVRPPKRSRSRGCLGIGCATILLALAVVAILAAIGGTRTTVKTGGEGVLVVVTTRAQYSPLITK
ncbi:hypothetical protein [Streptacidiphilus sp. P02-A3a]|uniref:hypothetical protein n=1 Tax=Streptacidiphilus sp. P02-A3a TaxID=2704468 RepID=UPI0015FCBD22|nr:hypothetical protein [Streptacidiphilus sp. P02-A3a]QMU68842.1 hypothetical protein GXP74_11985 [Streptacidiphilus sp. P02-A3a]